MPRSLVNPGKSSPQTKITVPEIIDPVFTKTSQNARFLLSENERFGRVFVKTGSINSINQLTDQTTAISRRHHRLDFTRLVRRTPASHADIQDGVTV